MEATPGRGEGSAPISIVIPVLDAAAYIGRALESVLNQGIRGLEVIVQDGGSKDTTAEIVGSFDDSRIKYLAEPDRGQADGVNRGLARASGAWILWLNADDELAPGGLKALVDAAGPSDDIVYGDFAIIDGSSRIMKRYRSSPLEPQRLRRRGMYVFSGAIAFRRRAIEAIGPLDTSLEYCMDYDFVLRAAEVVRARHVQETVVYFRWHADAKTRRSPWGVWREHWRVARRHGATYAEALPYQLELAAVTLANPLRRSAVWRALRPEKVLG